MYKPHYLNVERTTNSAYGGNKAYWYKTIVGSTGRKRKEYGELENKSGRRSLAKTK
ncbi:hypothetical protein IGI37_000095 [Enterococcus sp. AZ194]|uniref:hypothetical protein n=1 Tax=Enterococcus sp. AZ194 TaxID=2774629 RepID=UPI003F2971F6